MKKRRIAAFVAAALMAFNVGYSAVGSGFSALSPTAVETSAANSYSKDTEGFVTRMYSVVLGRTPDATGLKNWTAKLNNHTATASDLIYGFFCSDEYKGKNKSGEEIVTDCYNAMLDRNPDSTGKENWLKRLNVGMTTMAVCKGFVGSSEFKGLCSAYGIEPGTITLSYARDENYERTYFVYRLYANCLGRTPDIAGLENWCKNLKNGTTGTQIAKGFIFSSESKSKNITKDEYVTMLYKTLLGRTPDSSGLNNWINQLYIGKSKQYVANGFLFSTEFKGQCSSAGINLGSKISVPEDMTNIVYPVGNYAQGMINGSYMTQSELNQCAVKISNIIANNITSNMDDYTKTYTLFRWLCDNVSYLQDIDNNTSNPYGALINGRADCWGYATSFQYLCQAVGIECIFVVPVNWGYGLDTHRFNIVKISGQYYVCDPSNGSFLISDSDYHFSAEMKAIYPSCPTAHPKSVI